MSWAIFGDELVKLYHRGTHYKPRDMRTDTAYCVHGKQAFHNMITMLHFATNSRVKEKDMADCRCSRCMFYGVINMQKPALKTRVPRKQITRTHCRKKLWELTTNLPVTGIDIVRTDRVTKNARTC